MLTYPRRSVPSPETGRRHHCNWSPPPMRHLNWLLTLTLGFVSVSSLDDTYHPKALAAQNPAAAQTQEVSYRKLAPGVWLHTSSKEMPKWGKVISNGLVVEAGDHSLLVDTAWNDS